VQVEQVGAMVLVVVDGPAVVVVLQLQSGVVLVVVVVVVVQNGWVAAILVDMQFAAVVSPSLIPQKFG
jgi:hypothetical protein